MPNKGTPHYPDIIDIVITNSGVWKLLSDSNPQKSDNIYSSFLKNTANELLPVLIITHQF